MPSRTTWFILLPTFTVSALLFAIGIGSAWYVHRSNHIISDSLDDQLALAQSTERLVLAVREIRLELIRYTESMDPAHIELAKSWLEEAEANWPAVQPAQRSDPTAHEVLGALTAFLYSTAFASRSAEQRAGAGDLVTDISDRVLPWAEAQHQDQQQEVREMSRSNQLLADRIGIVLVTLGGCGAVAGILVGFRIAGSIHRSLVQISIPVQDMAGRLNEVVGPIVVEANTDLAGLDESLRKLSEKTADVVQRLQNSMHQSVRREQLAAIGQLASGLAHELRNPLMSVKLILQVALERQNPILKVRDLEIIQDEIARLERMVQTFLDFARPPRPHKTQVNLSRLVHAAVDIVQSRGVQQQVTLHVRCDSAAICLEADEMQLRQLLLNLLLNSLDALPDGGNVWVDVSADASTTIDDERARNQPDDRAGLVDLPETPLDYDHFVRISVVDDGAGIVPEVMDRLFEPFVSTKLTGIGLGLSICRQIVESHDGAISATNREQGAEFRIYLPRRNKNDADIAAQFGSQTDVKDN